MARKSLLDKMDDIAKNVEIKGNVIEIINVADKDLLDYPGNGEDITYTEDLEVSMKENGFTDPLEVTDYNTSKGKFMILSGHRRRAAGRKAGYTSFPCIIRHFNNDKDFENYNLMSNAYRNNENDPLLYCKRYKMHEDYLRKNGFKGSIREEIAKRLGMSVKSVERYNQMNKVILPVWDLVREDKVGMSSILFMARFSTEQQEEIYNILIYNLEHDITLTRDLCKQIKDSYEASLNGTPIVEIGEPELVPANVPDEEPASVETPAKPPKKTSSTDKPKQTDEEKLLYNISKIDEIITSEYEVSSYETAVKIVNNLKTLIIESLEEIEKISNNRKTDCTDIINEISVVLKDIEQRTR